MGVFEDKVASYSDVKKASDDIFLARKDPNEFYRILRRRYNGENGNPEVYQNRVNSAGTVVTPENQRELIEKLHNDLTWRWSPKDDRQKTNLTDTPGFGAVRLCPPHEEPNFDAELFEFCNNLCEAGDNVIDYGGGPSPFLAFIDHGNKIMLDKIPFADVMEPLGIQWQDSDVWKSSFDPNEKKHSGVVFCFHVLEHLSNPEEIIKFLSKFDVFFFATPREELIETSIYHHVYMQIEVFKKIFDELKVPAFMRTSKNGLDIHGIVVNSPKKWQYMKSNLFFNRNFKFYKEM
jgi:hypothetical protein